MNDREKLVELVKNARDAELCLCQSCFDSDECLATGYCDKSLKVEANFLIANGVTVQKHGRWIVLGQRTYGSGRSYTHYCSECGQHGFDDYKRCPNCGARMRKD